MQVTTPKLAWPVVYLLYLWAWETFPCLRTDEIEAFNLLFGLISEIPSSPNGAGGSTCTFPEYIYDKILGEYAASVLQTYRETSISPWVEQYGPLRGWWIGNGEREVTILSRRNCLGEVYSTECLEEKHNAWMNYTPTSCWGALAMKMKKSENG